MTKLRRFELHRDTDATGVSGTGVVAEGVAFTDGTVALRWRGDWPTSVVFHDRGVEAVRHIHGHGGATRLVWLDVPGPPPLDWTVHEELALLRKQRDAVLALCDEASRPGNFLEVAQGLVAVSDLREALSGGVGFGQDGPAEGPVSDSAALAGPGTEARTPEGAETDSGGCSDRCDQTPGFCASASGCLGPTYDEPWTPPSLATAKEQTS
jgi:hypothetical protein